jgi:glycerol kinase
VARKTTALGADLDEVKSHWKQDAVFTPSMNAEQWAALVAGWHKAVDRSCGWTDEG